MTLLYAHLTRRRATSEATVAAGTTYTKKAAKTGASGAVATVKKTMPNDAATFTGSPLSGRLKGSGATHGAKGAYGSFNR